MKPLKDVEEALDTLLEALTSAVCNSGDSEHSDDSLNVLNSALKKVERCVSKKFKVQFVGRILEMVDMAQVLEEGPYRKAFYSLLETLGS